MAPPGLFRHLHSVFNQISVDGKGVLDTNRVQTPLLYKQQKLRVLTLFSPKKLTLCFTKQEFSWCCLSDHCKWLIQIEMSH